MDTSCLPSPAKKHKPINYGYEVADSTSRYPNGVEVALDSRNASEKEAASALIGMSRVEPDEIKPAEWQDSIMVDVASVIRNPSANDEEESLLKLQAMINERLAKAVERPRSSSETQDSINEQIIVDLGEHTREETPAKSGRTTRNSKRARTSDNGVEKAADANGAPEHEP